MSNTYDPGRYHVRITNAVLTTSAVKGTEQILLTLQILGCYPTGQGLVPMSGPETVAYLYITEGTIGTWDKPEWVARLLADLGFIGPSFHNLEPLIGQERDAEMELKTYNGATLESWRVYPSHAANVVALADSLARLYRFQGWMWARNRTL